MEWNQNRHQFHRLFVKIRQRDDLLVEPAIGPWNGTLWAASLLRQYCRAARGIASATELACLIPTRPRTPLYTVENMRLGLVFVARASIRSSNSWRRASRSRSTAMIRCCLETNLSRELHLVADAFQLKQDQVVGLLHNAAPAAFASEEIRMRLELALETRKLVSNETTYAGLITSPWPVGSDTTFTSLVAAASSMAAFCGAYSRWP